MSVGGVRIGDMTTTQTGTTSNGVPYLAVPAASADAPVVVIWHLLDPPRTEAAMAGAIPLAGLDATRFYLGLPMSGSRTPSGGVDAIMALLGEDAPVLVHGPIWQQAVAEFPAAFAELRERFGVAQDAAVGLVGGSMGSAIAAGVLAAGTSGARAAVLLSPMLQLRAMIDSVSPQFGGYTWAPAGDEIAARMDFLARADEVTAGEVAIRMVAGADDDAGFLVPAREFSRVTGADLHELVGVGHALAEEPGVDAAPQTEGARRADALTADWLRAHLR
jgi:pimeloyl-ACP methyl ester carboxylesterase